MTTQIQPVARNLCLSTAVMLLFAAATATQAMEAPTSAAAQTTVEELVVLDDVWVHGKQLSRLIEVAEDKLFKLYNKLNKNDLYDVHCGDVSLERGSMIMVRTCVPGFLVPPNASYGYLGLQGRSMGYTGTAFQYGCSQTSYAFETGSTVQSHPGDCNYGRLGSDVNFSNMLPGNRSAVQSSNFPDSGYGASPALVTAVLHRAEYAQNVMRVITSDIRLYEMAIRLTSLYRDMELAQNRYVKVRKEESEAPKDKHARGKFPRQL